MSADPRRRRDRELAAAALLALALPGVGAAQLDGPLPPMRVTGGELRFDGHATVGDFTGRTRTVRGEMSGGESLAVVRGWVEAPVSSLETGNGRRDRDLNKSMESDRFPIMRFELTSVAPERLTGDSATVRLLGKLTLHGVTREVSLPARLVQRDRDLRLRSGFPVDLGDYDVGGLSKMMGMLRMDERIEVVVNLTFARR